MSDTADPAPSDDTKPFKSHHTAVQRMMLGLNVVVVLACFAGAGALIYGKRVRESFVAAPRATFHTATSADAATVASAPASTIAGQTPAAVPSADAPTETFPAADPKAENFLITGDDNNACIDPNSPYAGAVSGRENIGNRSDTIMVL